MTMNNYLKQNHPIIISQNLVMMITSRDFNNLAPS
jgi:hypothetical protein